MSVLTRMFPLLSEWVSGDKKQLNDKIRSWQKYSRPVVITGPDHVDQHHSLLFQCAVSYAKEGNNVTFICQTPVSKLPLPVHGMPKPNPTTLATVKFIYLKTMDEVHNYCASIHELKTCPNVIILDGIDVYIKDLKEQQASEGHKLAKLCALLSDAIHFCQQKTKFGQGDEERQCQLIISSKDIKTFTNVFQKTGFDIATLKAKEICTKSFRLSMDMEDQYVHLNYTVDETKGILLKDINYLTK